MKHIFIIILISLGTNIIGVSQDTLNVLFLGNSYTYYNNLPVIIEEIAGSQGDLLKSDQSTPGGYTLEGHTTNATSQAKIAEGDWDYVALQEQSQRPSFPPSQVSTQVYPYATELVNDIRTANPCTEPLFFMTWGRENGDQQNCGNYEPLCTYEGMQGRLTESYTEMAVDNKAIVSPVGEAWRRVRAEYPEINLYTADGSHPSIHGSYLAACVFYSMLFDKNIGGDYFVPSGITAGNAEILRLKAEETVFDTNETWNFSELEVVAMAEHAINDNELTCTNTSLNGTDFVWDFGDGNVSLEENPIHTYGTSGAFTVTHTVSNECTSDMFSFEVYAIVSGIENTNTERVTFYPNPLGNVLRVETEVRGKIEAGIFDESGRELKKVDFFNGGEIDLSELPKGIYFMKLKGEKLDVVHKILKN